MDGNFSERKFAQIVSLFLVFMMTSAVKMSQQKARKMHQGEMGRVGCVLELGWKG